MKEEEKEDFIDAETHTEGGREKKTFQDVIYIQIQRVLTLGAVEMRGGMWEYKENPDPSINIQTRTWLPDTREPYNNAVIHLHDLLHPHFDEEMKIFSEKNKQERDLIYNMCTKEIDFNEEPIEKKEKGIIVERTYRKFRNGNYRELYKEKIKEICDKLFAALNDFFARAQYLKRPFLREEM